MISDAVWLLKNIGPPKGIPTQFDVEYVTEGDGYASYSVSVSSLSELLTDVFEDAEERSIVRVLIRPVVKGMDRKLQLINFTGV